MLKKFPFSSGVTLKILYSKLLLNKIATPLESVFPGLIYTSEPQIALTIVRSLFVKCVSCKKYNDLFFFYK